MKARVLAVMTFAAVTAIAPMAMAQRFLDGVPPKHDPALMEHCRGAVNLVNDVGIEGRRSTPWNFNMGGGGGEGGRFDPMPVLRTRVDLKEGCLNAHLSAIVGSGAVYGGAPVTLFQVTLRSPVVFTHMYGHWETPYGIYAPAVALEAERDVDTYGSNFFQRVGYGPDDIPPGVYDVEVWWAGAGAPAGGATGAAFVLKLYH